MEIKFNGRNFLFKSCKHGELEIIQVFRSRTIILSS